MTVAVGLINFEIGPNPEKAIGRLLHTNLHDPIIGTFSRRLTGLILQKLLSEGCGKQSKWRWKLELE